MLTLTVVLSPSLYLYAQEDREIRRLLAEGSANRLYAYASSFEDYTRHHCSIYLLDRRDIAPGFEERTATFEYYTKATDTPHTTYYVYGYTIQLLTKDDSIVYYRLKNVQAEEGALQATPNYFADHQWLNTLHHRYKELFGVALDTTMLFISYGIDDEEDGPDVIYGTGCGILYEPP